MKMKLRDEEVCVGCHGSVGKGTALQMFFGFWQRERVMSHV